MRRPSRFRLMTAALTLLLAGCTTPAPQSPPASELPPLVWPAAPAEPRIVAERSFASSRDLGIKPGWGDRFVNALTGDSRGGEQLVKPFGVAVDERGILCLTDTGTNLVWHIDRERHRCQKWRGIGGVPFEMPAAVALAGGVIYVADSGRGQVVAFDDTGRLRFRLTSRLTRPSGVAVGGETLYVADSGAHCVVMFDRDGRPSGAFGRRGVAPGEFNFPTHVTTDAEGRVYVTDAMNSRVQVFDAAGRFLAVVGSLGDGSGHFSRPKGVAVDSHGHVYVADALFDNIQVFDRDGTFLMDLGGPGAAAGEFWMPAGIAIGTDNRIYVADAYNGRVQILRYIGRP